MSNLTAILKLLEGDVGSQGCRPDGLNPPGVEHSFQWQVDVIRRENLQLRAAMRNRLRSGALRDPQTGFREDLGGVIPISAGCSRGGSLRGDAGEDGLDSELRLHSSRELLEVLKRQALARSTVCAARTDLCGWVAVEPSLRNLASIGL